MAEILSQNEIDALLKAFDSGKVDVKEIKDEKKENKIRPYDFKRPNRFSKEQLRTLQMIFENMSRSFTTFLSGYLRTLVQVSVVSVEQITYYEFSNSLTNPVFIAIIEAEPLEGPILLELNSNTTFAIIDKILGGVGKTEMLQRDYTEIEIGLLTRIAKQLMPFVRDSWNNVTEFSPEITKIETNSQFMQIISPNETIALCTLSINLNESEGYINFCIPHIAIEPVLPKLTTKFWFSNNNKQKEGNIQYLKSKISNTYVPVTAVIGTSQITVKDLLNFEIGDIILIDRKYKEPIDIMINGKVKFKGKPGIKNRRNCVKITKTGIKGDEGNE
jgi:flagellar motor switch protein FliM